MAEQKITLSELQAKYAIEREKRLRADATAQYHTLSDIMGKLEHDPFMPTQPREPVLEEVDVAIIGAGIGGLVTAARLTQAGITDFRVIDKAGDFGGTWYWNRYPGAACDIVSYIYMPMLEETEYIPTEKYAKAGEIFEHCQRIANQFNLYPKALFHTEVSGLNWDDAQSRWIVTTDRGDRLSARFVITAGGILHKAKLPGIPGIERFAGKAFHSSRWDYDYTGGSPVTDMDKLRDKRVALIGTGATAVQIMPKLAEAAAQLYVVQRTPSGVGVRGDQATSPAWKAALKPGWQQAQIDNFTRIVSGKTVDEDLIQDGWTEIFQRNPAAMSVMDEEQQLRDAEGMEAIRQRIGEIVEDPATAEALKPWYNQLCKRPCFHDAYLPAFNRSNVTLLDTGGKGAEEITPNGVVVDGVEYPVDCIVYASGFETGGSHLSLMNFEIYGRDGISLTDAWADGPATQHGLLARGFPNLLRYSMTQGGIGINFAHVLSELAEHSAWIIRHCLNAQLTEIEPQAEAQDKWFQTLMAAAGSQGAFYASCTPSYANGEGGRPTNMAAIRHIPYFGGTQEFIDILKSWRDAGDLAGLDVRSATVEVR